MLALLLLPPIAEAEPACWEGWKQVFEDVPKEFETGSLECAGEGPLTYEIVTGPEHGSISGFNSETGSFTFNPETGFSGPDSLAFRSFDESGPSPEATIQFEVVQTTAGTPVHQLNFGHYGFGQGGFLHPADVATDDEGHVFVLDSALATIQKFTYGGHFLDEFGKPGSGNGQLLNPKSLDIAPSGDIVVADSGNDRIEIFGPEGEYISNFGTSGSGYTFVSEGHGHFFHPGGIAVDQNGDIFVADTGNHRIQKFNAEGEYLDGFKIREWNEESENTSAEEWLLAPWPDSVAVGPDGDPWFSETSYKFIFSGLSRFSPALEWLEWGWMEDSAAEAPEYEWIGAVDVDSRGNAWTGVRSGKDHHIIEFNSRGKQLNDFGHWSGFEGGDFDFSPPYGIDVDDDGHIWVTDSANHRVQRWAEHKGQRMFCEERDASTPVEQPLHLSSLALGCEGEAPFTYEIVSGPEHGAISEFDPGTGALTYTPESAFAGRDSFSFQVTNQWSTSPVMAFPIEVGDPPACEDQNLWTEAEEPLEVQLECTGDYAEEAFEITDSPNDGTVTGFNAGTGALTYVPDPEFRGVDHLTYRRASWVHSAEATVAITVCRSPRVEFWGSALDSESPGLGLQVYASPADWGCPGITSLAVSVDGEVVYSENRDCAKVEEGCFGMDLDREVQLPRKVTDGPYDLRVEAEDEVGRVAGEEFVEVETEGAGTLLDLHKEHEDKATKEGKCRKPKRVGGVVIGTPCADVVYPRPGADTYRGLGGADKIFGSAVTDHIRGGEGDDTLVGGRGSDFIYGEEEDDAVLGGSGDDVIKGGGGDDALDGGPGADKIKGEGGDDLVRGGATVDRLFGEGGENTLSYADGVTPGFFLEAESMPLVPGFPEKHGERGVYVNLGAEPFFGDNGETARFGGGADKIRDGNFQDVIGTPYADVIVGSEEGNVIDAGAGTDIVKGGGGNDSVYGGPDQDYLDGEGGSNTLAGGPEDTCLNGTASPGCKAELEGELTKPDRETILVGMVTGHSPGHEESVYVRGSDKSDHVKAMWSSGTITLEIEGGEALFGAADGCTVEEGGVKAVCTGPAISSYTAFGGDEDDILRVEGFPKLVAVTLAGGEGADRLIGGQTSEDALIDGPGGGEDVLKGLDGDDTLFSNPGKDTLMGGGGADLFVSSSLCDGDIIRGGPGNDNANWAQLVGPEYPGPGYPAVPTDPPYEEVLNGVNVHLANGVITREGSGCTGTEEATGSITGVENLEGSHGPDVLVGNADGNVLLGRAGSDVLRGRGGNDAILANNRNPTPEATPAEKKDLDTRLECGSGPHDVIKLDPVDREHFKLSELKGCETKPNGLVQKPANYSLPVGLGDESTALGEVLDERVIGAVDEPGAPAPAALFRFDEASGTGAVDWTWGAAEEEEGEPHEESSEELEEIEKEEGEEAEEENYEEDVEEEEPVGSYEGGVELGQSGALEESSAIKLDGVNDYVDLTSDFDPGSFIFNNCGMNVSGYSVEMWVKFGDEATGREELFSRSDDQNGVFLFRGEDGRIGFSVVDGVEAPTVTSDEAIDDSAWHQIVAVMAERGEPCASRSAGTAVTGEELESLDSPEMVLYVDGFPYALGVGPRYSWIIPENLPEAHNIVGAKALGSGFTNWLDGSVDDVAIYGQPLSFDQVESHLSVSDAVQPYTYLEPFPDPMDTDEDGVDDNEDNCSEVANPEQEDTDFNGVGDACEPESDSDEDGVSDEVDNCPDDPNPLQEDINENEVGDVCETVP